MNSRSQRVAQQILRNAIKYLVALTLMWSGSSESGAEREGGRPFLRNLLILFQGMDLEIYNFLSSFHTTFQVSLLSLLLG